jgi:hypothetical protein
MRMVSTQSFSNDVLPGSRFIAESIKLFKQEPENPIYSGGLAIQLEQHIAGIANFDIYQKGKTKRAYVTYFDVKDTQFSEIGRTL